MHRVAQSTQFVCFAVKMERADPASLKKKRKILSAASGFAPKLYIQIMTTNHKILQLIG